MSVRTWVILGATSIIANEFAHLAAQSGHALLLIGRKKEQLEIVAADLSLRYRIDCDWICIDFGKDINQLLMIISNHPQEIDLFIAHSLMLNNDQLTANSIEQLIHVNCTSTIQVIHAYWQKKQTQHQLVFLSSVAACRGRVKNSLYGASKAAVEVYLEGLQQGASPNQHITIARLGYIDTRMTYGQPGIFYASPPTACAKACWHAVGAKKQTIYHPFFWRYIMSVLTYLPFFIYKRLSSL